MTHCVGVCCLLGDGIRGPPIPVKFSLQLWYSGGLGPCPLLCRPDPGDLWLDCRTLPPASCATFILCHYFCVCLIAVVQPDRLPNFYSVSEIQDASSHAAILHPASTLWVAGLAADTRQHGWAHSEEPTFLRPARCVRVQLFSQALESVRNY